MSCISRRASSTFFCRWGANRGRKARKSRVLSSSCRTEESSGMSLVTVCSGGFHEDQICAARLEEVQAAAGQLAAEICQEINWPV